MSIISIDTSNISQRDAQEIVRLANILYFRQGVYEKTSWMGVNAAKCPMDMWVYQEIINGMETDLLVETGTLFGGSALYFAHLFDILDKGIVISIDIEKRDNLPQHPRIKYLSGSSISEEVISVVSEYAENSNSVTAILDSDHRSEYKLRELELYSQFVTHNNYVIAEDTCFDYYPAWPEFGPGPTAAVNKFLKLNRNFVVDRSREKHLVTFSPKAFLRKVK